MTPVEFDRYATQRRGCGEEYVHINNGVQLRVRFEDVLVLPGLGKHRLQIQTAISTASEQADAAFVTVSGTVTTEGPGGLSAYLGTLITTESVQVRRDITMQVPLFLEISDDQIRKLEEHRSRGDGGFGLRLALRFDCTDQQGKAAYNNLYSQPVTVSRETWLNIMSQVGYRRTLVVELEVPDSAASPLLSQVLAFYREARHRYEAGDYRGSTESIRQSLAALVGQEADQEVDPDAMTAVLKDARKRTRDDTVGYEERMEIVRQALKFTADLGAHPEVEDTHRAEALAQLQMAAGVIQWFSGRRT